MNQQELIERVRRAIPEGSIGRYDLLPLFADTALFSELVRCFSALYAEKVDCIASPEAIGWILGTAIAKELNVAFIPIRKRGKLPYPNASLVSCEYRDYSNVNKSLEIKRGSLAAGSRVLVVDEWIETGASIRCCMELLESEGGIISGLATIGINYNEDTMGWIDSGFVSFIGRDI
jgi:adenine phosphoribosyltransferase